MPEGIIYTWGTEPDERVLPFPCDTVLGDSAEAYFRGITIRAGPDIVFRWLCQMRAAPYSYDWLDNFGRRSPQTLTPGLDQLAVGQTVMTIFELASFVPGEHLTIRTPQGKIGSGILGKAAISYVVVPKDDGACRLLVKLAVRYPRGPIGWLMRLTLPAADLIMMRRQLLNFKSLAEGLKVPDPTPRRPRPD